MNADEPWNADELWVLRTAPLAEIPTHRARMEAAGMTTWLADQRQLAAWAGGAGYEGWLRERGYDPTTSEAVHVDEINPAVVLLLGAYRAGGSA